MCGFVGFIDHIENKEKVINDMMDTIIHRGPDSEGVYCDEDIALGFRRLSIIGLENGKQPMCNEDESIWLTFNGEIYNYQPIKADLIRKGHVFKTTADSEVLIHLYEEYGHKFLTKLRGMFAFVIWDKNKKRLFGARDYFGIKPMYYGRMGDTFMFGSEIKSFMPHPNFKKELNEAALEEYLSFQYSALKETFFKNVYRLYPAHYFIYENDEMTIKRYWQPEFKEEDQSFDQCVEEIHETFLDSVKAHKISDVEVASFLSSGVDSSYAAAALRPDKTFTVGFDFGEKYNEISYAEKFAKELDLHNTSKVISAKEYWDELPKIQYHMDEPLADPAAVALYFVCQLASEHVKVVLSGEGADELFGGYRIYSQPYAFEKYEKVPKCIRQFLGMIAYRLPNVKGKNFLINGSKTVEERFIGNAHIFRTKKERDKVLKRPGQAPMPQRITKQFYRKVSDQHDITKMQYLDIHMWLQGDILLKADKMSMAHSLELRVPFLDKEVMALASKIPLEHRVAKTNTKLAMRMAANKLVPKKTADKEKLGFPVPIREWLKEDQYYTVVKEAFLSDSSKKYFNSDELVRILDEHYDKKADNSRKIWTVYTFILWYNQYFV